MSPWAIFLMIIYPALELVFSTLRRLINKSSPLKPDNKHLHSLFFIYLSTIYIRNKTNFVNSFCGVVLTIFWSNSVCLCLFSECERILSFYRYNNIFNVIYNFFNFTNNFNKKKAILLYACIITINSEIPNI